MFDEDVKLPKSLKPKGHVKLELIDKDTKEVVDTVEGDNFISKGMEWLYQVQMKMLFYRFRLRNSNGALASFDATNIFPDVFNRLIMTDNVNDMNRDESWFVQGDIVANTSTTTGNMVEGPLGGQYNLTDSFYTDEMMRIVIDFPSEASNGTIGSVYFQPSTAILGSGGTTGTSSVIREVIRNLFKGIQLSSVENTRSVKVLYYDDYYITTYLSRRTPRIDVYDSDLNLKMRRSLDLMYANKSNAAIGSCIKGNKLYVLGGTSGNIVYMMDVQELLSLNGESDDNLSQSMQSMVEVKALNTNTLLPGSYSTFRGILYNESRGQFILGRVRSDNSYRFEILIMNEDFELLNIIEYPGLNRYTTLLDIRDGYIFLNDGTIDLESMSYTPGGFYNMNGIVGDDLMISSTHYASDFKLHPKFGFASCYRLPSPVIKTEQHIMRVTYDFKFPSIYGDKEN